MMTRPLVEVAEFAQGTLLSPQAGRAAVTGVVTDSRRAGPGSFFVAIKGERTDGHAHLAAAARAGAVGALVSDQQAARAALAGAGLTEEDLPLVLVADTVTAVGDLARGHLADLRRRAGARGSALRVVAMTGSVGKTTTKDLTRQLLAPTAPTIAPVASFNNEIGLPLTVLEASEATRFLVLEMGASAPGHIDYLTAIAPPDAAAVLMIGHAHMGGFGSIEGVAQAKSEIIAGLVPGGTAVLNHDDARARAMASLASGPVLTFSAQGDPQAAVRATGTVVDDRARAAFDLHLPGVEPRRVRLGVPGVHNIVNALAASGLALAAGLGAEAIAERLEGARMESPHRMDVVALGGDLLLVDDSYNANIDSMSAALRALPALAGRRRRVVVVSEMLELGDSSRADHRRTGQEAAAAGAQLLVTVGAGAGPAAQEARAAGVEVVELPDATTAIAQIDSLVHDGDAVLVKGSHGSGAWRLADHLKEVRPR